MRKLYIVCSFVLFILQIPSVFAQLTTGDIAFVGFNADGNDDVAIVALKSIDANSVIYFRDGTWNGSAVGSGGAFSGGNTLTWTTPANSIPAGTVIVFSNFGTTPTTNSNGVVAGSTGLSASGERIFCYVGSDGNTPTTFIAGISTEASSPFGNLAGTGLTIGTSAISFGATIDIAAYTGVRNASTINTHLSAINNTSNWITEDTGSNDSNNTTAPDLPFSTTAFTFSGADITPPGVTFSPANNATGIAINALPTITFDEDVRLLNNTGLDNSNVDALVELRLLNSSGTAVPFDASVSGRIITITPSSSLSNSQIYYVALKANTVEDLSDNAIPTVQSSSFTTLSLQTQFSAGDIAFVGFNADGNDDVAIVALKSIDANSVIYFRDGTWNGSAIGSGGAFSGGNTLTWTTPTNSIPAGTVIVFSNFSTTPTTNSNGVVTGSTGLSTGGERIFCYVGTDGNTPTTFIAGISTEASSPFGSLAGTGLTVGTSAISFGATIDIAAYTGVRNASTVNGHLSAINNTANWMTQDTGGNDSNDTVTPDLPFSTAAFTFSSTDTTPPGVVFSPANGATGIALNALPTITFDENVRLMDNTALDNSNVDALVELRLSNSSGTAVSFDATVSGRVITVIPSATFQGGQAYYLALKANTIEDVNDNALTTVQSSLFTALTTSISFDKRFISVQEEAGTLAVKIKLANPSASSVSLVVKGTPFSTATSEDFTLATQTLTFTGTSPLEQTINIPIINDNIGEQDEYFVLSLESATNATITGGNLMTIYIKDNDRLAPVPTKAIELTYVTSFNPGSSTAEIVVHDPTSQRLFIISSVQDRLDIADFSNPADIKLIKSIDMLQYGGITSVATKNGIVAVASPNANEQLNGSVVFFTTDGVFQKQVTVGALPDMITFSPDGKKVMTANEGQPNDAYTVDPEGSVSIIDISGGIATLDQSKVTTLLFDSFNSQEATLRAAGVRKLKLTSTLSQDFEPEYITISSDSRKAWVTIQENNAIGEIDLESKTITSVWAMGKKDISIMGNGIDASDNSGIVTIANWPVKSFYIPDAIANYTVSGVQYLVTANEGDEKEYSGLNERTTVGDVVLDPTIFPHAAMLKETHNIGRLRMTKLSGDTDNDGDYDEINIPGSRSFTIWNAATKTKVFDSGDDFERYISTEPSIKALFNADNENNTFKSRSRAKGPEPEGLTIASINGKSYAFIGLERVGGVMVYDITDPANAKFVDYKNSRSTTSYSGDHGPEGILYISPDNSPNGKAYIAVANEISGTVSLFEVTPTPKKDQTITFNALANKTVGDAPFALTATASSTLAVSYTTTDDKITIAGAQVTLVKAGKTTITANQDGNTSYNTATKVSQTFCVNPAKPTITMTDQDTESPVLQSSAVAGNQWYRNGAIIAGATNATLTVTTAGVYTVKATIETCESVLSSDFPVIVTGDINNVAASSLQIIPNPAKEFVKLQLPETGHKQITIYQLSGAIKEVHSTAEQEEELDIRSWNEGYYLIRVTTSKGNYYGRFIKN